MYAQYFQPITNNKQEELRPVIIGIPHCFREPIQWLSDNLSCLADADNGCKAIGFEMDSEWALTEAILSIEDHINEVNKSKSKYELSLKFIPDSVEGKTPEEKLIKLISCSMMLTDEQKQLLIEKIKQLPGTEATLSLLHKIKDNNRVGYFGVDVAGIAKKYSLNTDPRSIHDLRNEAMAKNFLKQKYSNGYAIALVGFQHVLGMVEHLHKLTDNKLNPLMIIITPPGEQLLQSQTNIDGNVHRLIFNPEEQDANKALTNKLNELLGLPVKPSIEIRYEAN